MFMSIRVPTIYMNFKIFVMFREMKLTLEKLSIEITKNLKAVKWAGFWERAMANVNIR